ncbi:MAG: hypothetical protein HQL95_04995 [Magnetococcales bacterium]|nr:hypothetical protein [Magnetococcales bacterium]
MQSVLLPRRVLVFLRSQTCGILTALVMLITSGVEVWQDMATLFKGNFNIGAHHGVMLYSLLNLMSHIAEVLDAGGSLEEKIVPVLPETGS